MMNKNVIAVLLVVTVGLLACKKGAGDLPPDSGQPASINVINITADTLNVFQNGMRFNYTSSLYPAGATGYLQVLAGQHQYQVKRAGTPDVLLSLPMQLDTNRAYSFFISGTNTDRVFLTNDVFLNLNDVEIRFVNASPGMVFNIKIASNFDYTDREFKSATDFVTMTAGKNYYELYVVGNPTPVAKGDLTLAERRVYTLYTKGTLNGTGDNAFGVRLMTNR